VGQFRAGLAASASASASPSARQPSGQIARLQARQPRRRADQQPRAAVGQDMRDLRALQQRVDRHMDQPGPRRGQRHQAGQLALGRPVATRAPAPAPCSRSHPASRATRVLKSLKLSVPRAAPAPSSSSPRSARWSSGRIAVSGWDAQARKGSGGENGVSVVYHDDLKEVQGDPALAALLDAPRPAPRSTGSPGGRAAGRECCDILPLIAVARDGDRTAPFCR
jgi:hypothetical protein